MHSGSARELEQPFIHGGAGAPDAVSVRDPMMGFQKKHGLVRSPSGNLGVLPLSFADGGESLAYYGWYGGTAPENRVVVTALQENVNPVDFDSAIFEPYEPGLRFYNQGIVKVTPYAGVSLNGLLRSGIRSNPTSYDAVVGHLAKGVVAEMFRFHQTTGRVHGDIKAENVCCHLESGVLQVKLLDFVNAKPSEAIFTRGFTHYPQELAVTGGAPYDVAPVRASFYFDYFLVALLLLQLASPQYFDYYLDACPSQGARKNRHGSAAQLLTFISSALGSVKSTFACWVVLDVARQLLEIDRTAVHSAEAIAHFDRQLQGAIEVYDTIDVLHNVSVIGFFAEPFPPVPVEAEDDWKRGCCCVIS